MKKKDLKNPLLKDIPKDLQFVPCRDRMGILPTDTWSCLILDTVDKVVPLGGKEGLQLYYYLSQYAEGMSTKWGGDEEAQVTAYVDANYVWYSRAQYLEFSASMAKYTPEAIPGTLPSSEIEPVDIAFAEVIPGYLEFIKAAMETYNGKVTVAQAALDADLAAAQELLTLMIRKRKEEYDTGYYKPILLPSGFTLTPEDIYRIMILGAIDSYRGNVGQAQKRYQTIINAAKKEFDKVRDVARKGTKVALPEVPPVVPPDVPPPVPPSPPAPQIGRPEGYPPRPWWSPLPTTPEAYLEGLRTWMPDWYNYLSLHPEEIPSSYYGR